MSANDSATATTDREDWWGDRDDDLVHEPTGHTECTGTNAAEFVAKSVAMEFVDPVCSETGRPLTDPVLHLGKQYDTGHGFQEYGVESNRRRYEPESGKVNWGESTSTKIPNFGRELFDAMVNHYLSKRWHNDALTLTNLEGDGGYWNQANRVWHDPQYESAIERLAAFVSYVRDEEPDNE